MVVLDINKTSVTEAPPDLTRAQSVLVVNLSYGSMKNAPAVFPLSEDMNIICSDIEFRTYLYLFIAKLLSACGDIFWLVTLKLHCYMLHFKTHGVTQNLYLSTTLGK